jgi:hypothetical protein
MLPVTWPSVAMSPLAICTDSLIRFIAASLCRTTSRPEFAVNTASSAAIDARSAWPATSLTVAFICATDEAKNSTFLCSSCAVSEICLEVASISVPAAATCAEERATSTSASLIDPFIRLMASIASASSS